MVLRWNRPSRMERPHGVSVGDVNRRMVKRLRAMIIEHHEKYTWRLLEELRAGGYEVTYERVNKRS